MAVEGTKNHEEIVTKYFNQLGAIFAGEAKAIDEMLRIWDEDGSCEFVGAHPYNGEFRGRNAVHVLFNNLAHTAGMSLRLEGRVGAPPVLGPRKFEPSRIRTVDDKVVVDWTSAAAMKDGKGLSIAGSDTFSFKGDKISSLRIVISPKVEGIAGLRPEDLSINDIGRLALAAWAVV